MAKKTYRASSPEGAAWAGVEEGENVELELSKEDELPLIAAGWLEEAKTKKGADQ